MDAVDVVNRCFEAMVARDVEGVVACFHDDAEFWPLPAVHLVGKPSIRAMFEEFLSTCVEMRYDTHREGSVGNLFFSERTDYIVMGDHSIEEFIGCGVFEFEDGLIKHWRDYFYLTPEVADAARKDLPIIRTIGGNT